MGKAIPSQHHPAVVLRSHSKALRALLAVALIAVVAFTAALVVIANDNDSGTTSASPTGQINYGGFNPATGRPDSAPLPQRDAQARSDTTRYDGGPEEGSRDIQQSSTASAAPVYVNPSTGYPSTRYDSGPEEGTTAPSR
jgi:hypothetical protein